MLQPEDMVANGLHIGNGVRYEDNGDAAGAQFVHLAHTTMPEVSIANRECLIDEEHLGIHTDGNGESQPHYHAARVSLNGLADEIPNLGEVFDRLVAPVDFAFGKAEDGGVEIDVVTAGEFGIEAASQFEQCGDTSADVYGAARRLRNAGDELQRGAFSRAVFADDAEDFAAFNGKAQISEGLEIAMVGAPTGRQKLLKAVAWLLVYGVAFCDVLELDGIHGNSQFILCDTWETRGWTLMRRRRYCKDRRVSGCPGDAGSSENVGPKPNGRAKPRPTRSVEVEVIPATLEQEPILANLLELYGHDFSEFFDLDIGEDGRFGYTSLPLYWSDPNCHPFLLRIEGKLAGLAFVKRGDAAVWDIAEFFVVRGYRRLGIGTQAAHEVWRRFPGMWQVRVMQANVSGERFWAGAISTFTGEAIQPVSIEAGGERWSVFSFESKGTI